MPPAVDEPDGPARPVVAVQVRDVAAALGSLRGVTTSNGSTLGLAGAGEWLVVDDTDAHAREVLDAATRVPLADVPRYAADLDRLPGRGIATVWMDHARLADGLGQGGEPSVTDSLRAAGLAVDDPSSEPFPAMGHGAATVRFAGDDLELVGSMQDLDPAQALTGGPVRVDAPVDAAGVLAISGTGELVTRLWTTLTLTYRMSPATERQVEQTTGLLLPEDLRILFGDQAQVVLAPGATPREPAVGLRVTTRAGDVEARLAAAQAFLTRSGAPSPPPVLTDDGYALELLGRSEGVTQGGDLSASTAFQDAVPDAAGAQLVGYMDLQRTATALGGTLSAEDRRTVETLGAVGLSYTQTDRTTAEYRMRLTTR